MERIKFVFVLTMTLAALTACAVKPTETTDSSVAARAPVESSTSAAAELGSTEDATGTTQVVDNQVSVNFDSDDLNTSIESEGMTAIHFNNATADIQGEGVSASGQVFTISAAGTYLLSGDLNDGQIIIDTDGDSLVRLILNGVNLTSSTSAPIYVRNAHKTVITLAEGTQNTVSDGSTYIYDVNEEPNAAIFSNDDLTFNGTGSLTVIANFNNGIRSDDDLRIVSGSISVNAVNDAIKGKNVVAIKDGQINIEAGNDGIQSDNDEDASEGNIIIEGGSIDITSDGDGIQAVNTLEINNGSITVTSGGGSANSAMTSDWGDWDQHFNPNVGSNQTETDSVSAKGLKSDQILIINGGTFTIDSADDTIHSNNTIQINDGEFQLSSGDDGIHADSSIEINNGSLALSTSYEGVESETIVINNGEMHIISSDDGINGVSGDTSNQNPGGRGMDGFGGGNASLVINNGYVYVDAGGDGIDINGTVAMTGGTVIVNGPTQSMNGALDYTGSFSISGGILIAVGSIGMAEAPSQDSSQPSVMVNFDTVQNAGSLFHIETGSGENILTFAPTKVYQSVVFSSPELSNGESYAVFTGGTATGSPVDGLYEPSTYSTGAQMYTFSISSVVTALGKSGGMIGQPGSGIQPGGGGQPGHRP